MSLEVTVSPASCVWQRLTSGTLASGYIGNAQAQMISCTRQRRLSPILNGDNTPVHRGEATQTHDHPIFHILHAQFACSWPDGVPLPCPSLAGLLDRVNRHRFQLPHRSRNSWLARGLCEIQSPRWSMLPRGSQRGRKQECIHSVSLNHTYTIGTHI